MKGNGEKVIGVKEEKERLREQMEKEGCEGKTRRRERKIRRKRCEKEIENWED